MSYALASGIFTSEDCGHDRHVLAQFALALYRLRRQHQRLPVHQAQNDLITFDFNDFGFDHIDAPS